MPTVPLGSSGSDIDLSDTTATAEDVKVGKIFHLADGSSEIGTLTNAYKEFLFMGGFQTDAYALLFTNNIYQGLGIGASGTSGEYISCAWNINKWEYRAVKKALFRIINNGVDLGVVEKNAGELIYSREGFTGNFEVNNSISIWIDETVD